MKHFSPREVAIQILYDIHTQDAYSNMALKNHFEQHPEFTSLDRSFITELVNGTLRNQNRIDYIIDQFSSVPKKKLKPWILLTLRTALYQILFMTKVPQSAACNEAVRIIKGKGMGKLSGFVNGVLRTMIRNIDCIVYPNEVTHPVDYLSIYYSFPTWIIKQWLSEYPYEFVKELCKSSNETPWITVRCNTVKTTPEILFEQLKAENIEVSSGLYMKEAIYMSKTSYIRDSKAFQQGLFQVQDESSMIVGQILDPQPHEVIIDVCAAPGGKTTHCAQKMNNQGKILARDIHEHKLHLIDENCKRLGIDIVITQQKDASMIDPDQKTVDRIMIDAPCSGLGIIRKKPDIKWNKDLMDISSLVELQRKILHASSHYVKPGGILVYSTCTICKVENENNVEWFVANYPYELEDLRPFLPIELYTETASKGYIQLFPHIHKTDGFFIARFKRKG